MRSFAKAFVFALGLLLLAAPGVAQNDKPEFELTDYEPQVVRGHSIKVVAYGKQLQIQSLEIDAADGVTLTELKEEVPDAHDARQNQPQVRVWSFVVTASQEARLDKRSIVAVTPAGRSWPRDLRVTTHAPAISNPRILSTDSNGSVEFEFDVADSEGDITLEKPPHVTTFLDCSNYVLFQSMEAYELVLKDPHHGTVHHKADFGSPGRELKIHTGYCTLKVSVTDSGLNRSNELQVRADFKE